MATHLVEGTVLKKLKQSIDVTFPAMQAQKVISLSHNDVLKSSKTFLNPIDFPVGSIAIKTIDDIDYLQGKA